MKLWIVTMLLSASCQLATGQQFYVAYGRTISSFDYEDSNGNSLDNLYGTSSNSMAVGYRAPIAKQKWFITAGATYNKYGARGSDMALDKYYAWDVSYLGANVGVDFEFLKQQSFFKDQDGLSFYAKAGIATEFLVQGTQTINNQLFKLNGVEQFDRPVFFARAGVGANYCVSRRLAIFLEYLGGKSFSVFGRSSGDKEKLQYNAHTIRFGLLLSLPNCDYCHTTL